MKAEDLEKIDRLFGYVKSELIRRAEHYDGYNTTNQERAEQIHVYSVTEEVGEVVSALTRCRYELAKQECLDVVRSAFNLYFTIENKHGNGK